MDQQDDARSQRVIVKQSTSFSLAPLGDRWEAGANLRHGMLIAGFIFVLN